MEESRFALFTGLMNRAAKSIHRIKSVKMKRYCLSAAHTTCLCKLAEAGAEGLTQGQLTALEGMDRAQISRVLGELRQRGYVALSDQGGHYRRRHFLTPAGQETAADMQRIILEINRSVSASIPLEDIEVFYRTLRTITQNLEREAALCR